MIEDDFYEQYGESLATRLASIAHSPDDPAFVFVEEMGNPKEVLDSLNGGVIRPDRTILVWENHGEDLDTGGRDNYHGRWPGSLCVLQQATDRAGIRRAKAECRRILLAVIALMLADAQDGILEEQTIGFELRNVACEAVGPVVSNWYGYACDFSWTVPLDLDLQDGDLLEAA